jgi:small-conductance mechanosensitive channel
LLVQQRDRCLYGLQGNDRGKKAEEKGEPLRLMLKALTAMKVKAVVLIAIAAAIAIAMAAAVTIVTVAVAAVAMTVIVEWLTAPPPVGAAHRRHHREPAGSTARVSSPLHPASTDCCSTIDLTW